MPSFCATPSELVRQHPKRNTPPAPPPQTSIQHMLLLSLLHVPPRMPTEMGSVYQKTMCVCAHARPRLWNKRRVLWGTVGKEHMQSDSHCVCVCTCACVRVCVSIWARACVWVFVYVWEGRLCWSVPECWKWQGGSVGKDPCCTVCMCRNRPRRWSRAIGQWTPTAACLEIQKHIAS